MLAQVLQRCRGLWTIVWEAGEGVRVMKSQQAWGLADLLRTLKHQGKSSHEGKRGS